MGDCDLPAVDAKRLSLIDVSFEDDRLIDTSPARPVGTRFLDGELLHSLDFEKADEEGRKMASKPLESEERASKTPENYHLRKSLAWDAAFFTSDGVLEPEELTSMIEDAGKKEKHTLPMILEETQRSTESISTLASDTLTLASLESDLFEDIRASIQKSSKTSNIQTFGSEAGQSSSEAYVHHSSRKTDLASEVKLKTKTATKKSSLGMVRPGKTTNQVPLHRRVLKVQSIAEGGDSNAISLPSKPPKPGMLSTIPSSTKRESLGPNRMRPEKSNMEGRGDSAAKVPVSRGIRSIVPRPSSTSLSARSASVETKMITPSDRSASSSSNKSKKSAVNLRNKALGPESRKLSSASSSMLKTPPRSTPSRLSAHLTSATELSSSISPASSISEWSLESSSSASTVKQRSNDSRASLEASSSGKSCDGGDNKQLLDEPKTHGSASSNLSLRNASTRGALLLPNSMRPSGLRMPSPKIGFFDGMKSGRTPNARQMSPQIVPSGLPKIEAEISKPDGSINRVKVLKFHPARTTTASNSMKGDSKQFSLGGSQKFLPPKSSNSVEKVPTASGKVKRSSPGISPRVQSRLSPKFGSQNQLKVEEIKAKETNVKTCDNKESKEVKPVSDTWSSETHAIDGGLQTSNAIMDLVDKAGARSPVKQDTHVENGSGFDHSLTRDSSILALSSRNIPICDQMEPLNCLSKFLLSPSIAKTDIATGARQPFCAIDSFCNMDDSSAVSMGLATATAELGKRIALPATSSLNKNS